MLVPKPNYSCIGHRGAAGLAPENTKISFKYAQNYGLNWIEFDTQQCASKEWIIIHDTTLERTTNGNGKVENTEYTTLQHLDAGSWFNPKFANEKILTLDETLNFCLENNLYPNIEVKNPKGPLIDTVHSFLDTVKKYQQPTLPMVSSFNTEFLILLKKIAPFYPIGYLIEEFDNHTINTFFNNDFTSINASVKYITEDNIKTCNNLNISLFIYTVNSKSKADQLFASGISAVFTDRPDLLVSR